MQDTFGHSISYLRVSITDRCNERCRYCMPQEIQEWLPKEDVLSYEEILRLVRVGVGLGITKVRVTGGEPLTRRDVLEFMRALGRLPGLREIGLSTNGTLLASRCRDAPEKTYAQDLHESGVASVNLSLDSLDRETYRQSTGRDYLDRVLEGIDAARAAGFERIKLNTVLMRHRNEKEIPDLIEFARAHDLLIRFIELMPVSTTEVLTEDNFFSVGHARKKIEERYGVLEPLPDFKTNGPALYYRVPGTEQKIGFIGAMTNLHFCESCNKLRLTCDGKLRPCLGSHLEFDIKGELRKPEVRDEDLAQFFGQVVARKPKEHEFRDNYQPDRKMIAIGG